MPPSGSARRRDLGGPPSERDANRGLLGSRGRLEDGGVGKKEGLCRAGAELRGEGGGHGLRPVAGRAREAGGLHWLAFFFLKS